MGFSANLDSNDKGYTIIGKIKIDSNIKIINPVSITLKTKGDADFIDNL